MQADVVVPGARQRAWPAALGFAQASGIPYELGIIRSHYMGRTFIQADLPGACANWACA